ncbi:MAG: UDP-N-acetylmuramate--L-alanine ligase [Patescibacteria group bacterium]|jgi:UDP-N-acetylmuramate--alanine ligase
MNLLEIKKIHFIGIGGIGISATARLARDRGIIVSGSDAQISEVVDDLRSLGLDVKVPQRAENVPTDADLAVYTVAAPEANPERMRVKELGIEQMTYPQFLQLLLADKFGISVSGTNGKTTTTAMIAKILIDADKDPSVVLGAKADFLSGNARSGRGEYFVFESDEYRRAFDNYYPQIAAVTYIGEDHLDYYKDLAEIKSAFGNYLSHVPAEGYAVLNADDPNSMELAPKLKANKVTFGITGEADYKAVILNGSPLTDGRSEESQVLTLDPSALPQDDKNRQTFSVTERGRSLGQFSLLLPGRYNVYNALCAIAVCRTLGIDVEIIRQSLAGFTGTWRRFERLGRLGQAEVIADYAHTPDAVAQVISATKEFYPGKKILIVFQPHQYSRTKNLFNKFVTAFGSAEQVIIPDIFYVAGREKPEDFAVDSKILAEAIAAQGVRTLYGGSLAESEKLIRMLADDFDVILILGAGDVYELAKNLVK